jgi:hypothetical protein
MALLCEEAIDTFIKHCDVAARDLSPALSRQRLVRADDLEGPDVQYRRGPFLWSASSKHSAR